ncbi:MAG: ABC transporter substrate-binding protein [Pseudomonadota bacterium]
MHAVSTNKFIAVLGLILGVVAAPVWALANDADGAVKFVRATTEDFRVQFSRVEGEAEQRALVDQTIAPHFDFDLVSRLVLGKYWRKTTAEQKLRITAALRARVVNIYHGALAGNKHFEIGYLGFRARENSKDVLVRTEVRRPEKPAFRVNYRMRRAGDEWKVVDVIVGGVSLVITHRKEFYEVIGSNGLDGLTRSLDSELRGS